MVVDTGTGARSGAVIGKIRKLVDGKEVSAIVLTHCHYDHAGGAAAFSRELHAPVYAHRLDAGAVREGSGKKTVASMFSERIEPVEVADLNGGETISTGEHELRVLHTPGHTEGGLSLFDQEKKILVSGDTVFAGGVGRWDLPTGDREKLVASIKMLQALGPVDLYPGHGPSAVGDAEEQLKDALRYLGEF